VHPFTPGTFRTMYPSGRSYLFDMGAGHWDEGSLTWFITVWGRRGIVFDEIYGAQNIDGILKVHSALCSIGVEKDMNMQVKPLSDHGERPLLRTRSRHSVSVWCSDGLLMQLGRHSESLHQEGSLSGSASG